jgi:hypothetical protein
MTKVNEANARFEYLLSLAEDHYAAANYLAAARLVQVAAFYAFPANVGLFASSRLERLLLDIAKQIPDATDTTAKQTTKSKSRRILHVLSYAKPIGGDSRYVWRWMKEDANSQHSLAITLQAEVKDKYDIPEIFLTSAEQSGGFVKALGPSTSNPLQLASELRALCQNADFVVLHLYPYDIIPVLALGASCDSVKVIYIHHSDHTFWVGASVANSVIHLRKQPLDFLRLRRGLSIDDNPILPIPIVPLQRSLPKEEAKRLLGYSEDTVVILTIASPFKYFATGQITFLDLVVPVLKQFPQAVLIAVGPDAKGAWLSANNQTEGRIIALGRRWDNENLYDAADIYLDSVPCSSITSTLEAGSHGLPILGYSPSNSEMCLLEPGGAGLDKGMLIAKDVDSYKVTLSRLIGDRAFRIQQGHKAQQEILSMHTGTNWLKAVDQIFHNMGKTKDRLSVDESADTFDQGELDKALTQLYSQVQGSGHARQLISDFIGTLPYALRLPITCRLYLKGFELCYINLLPPPTDKLIRYVGRNIKKKLHFLFS